MSFPTPCTSTTSARMRPLSPLFAVTRNRPAPGGDSLRVSHRTRHVKCSIGKVSSCWLTWSGHGNQQLETFPIEHFTWRVRWETRNESPPGAGRFRVTANSGDSGRILAEVVDVQGVGKDITYITELPHRYYFVVTSAGVDWALTAEEAIQ